MLNQVLVSEFEAAHREQRNGSLVLQLGERSVRFGFESGEITLLDLGEDKEVALARKLLDYHKIGPEIHRHALNLAKGSGQSIIETLRRQQLVAENEIDQVAQAMVEDMLSLVFGLGHAETRFVEEGPDTYDVERRAVRLRIDVPSLLAGVTARLDEEESTEQEIGGYQSIYSHDEGADPSQLGDLERHILGFIDGKKTVEQVAIGFRDSNFNMGRSIVAILRKGFIRRIGGLAARPSSGLSGPNPTTGLAPKPSLRPHGADETGTPPAEPTFELYRPPEEKSNLGSRIALAAVFVVVAVLGFLVLNVSRKQAKVSQLLGDIDSSITTGAWASAASGLKDAHEQMTNDLGSARRIEELEAKLQAALQAEGEAINELVDEREFDKANDRLGRLPADMPNRSDLVARYTNEKQLFEQRSMRLERQVRDRLDEESPKSAFAIIDKAPAKEAEKALVSLDRWRIKCIEEASLNSLNLGRRQALINLIQSARPNSSQKAKLDDLQAELLRGQNRRQEQVRQVSKQVELGDYLKAAAEVERQRLLDQAPGSPLLAEAQALVVRIGDIRASLEKLPEEGYAAIASSGDEKSLNPIIEKVKEALATYPEASNRTALETLSGILETLKPFLGKGTTIDEAAALRTAIRSQQNDTNLVKAVETRVSVLKAAAIDAETAREEARRLGREGRWDDAIRVLRRIKDTPDWKRTPIGVVIDDEIVQAESSKVRIQELEKTLKSTMLAGDFTSAYSLVRELGRPYLPLLVDSVPKGATVLKNGEVIGKTPLILDISALERVDLSLDFQHDGYEPQTLAGTDAVGGWRLSASLTRLPKTSLALGLSLTAKPSVQGAKLWLAGPEGVVWIDSEGASGRPQMPALPEGQTEGPSLIAPAGALVDGIYFASRSGVALRITTDGRVDPVVLAGSTDHAPTEHRSQVILDRHLVILASTDGTVAASDPENPQAAWNSPQGGLFVGSPVVRGERVLAARKDGSLICLQVDRGTVIADASVNGEIIASWTTPSGIAGLTAKTGWAWDGKELTITALPREARAGNEGVIVSKDSRVLVLEGEEWKLLGTLTGRPSGMPIRWMGRVAVPCGNLMEVVGPGGFKLTSEGAFLDPVISGERLALITSDGQVRIYDP